MIAKQTAFSSVVIMFLKCHVFTKACGIAASIIYTAFG